MRHRFDPARPAALHPPMPPRAGPISPRPRRHLSALLALLVGLASSPAGAAPELVAGVFRFSSQIRAGEDGNTQLWMRNPLVLEDHLMFRIKEGRWSSVYAYRLDDLADGIGTWSAEPVAVGPSRADVLAQKTSPFQAPPIPTITALFRGPAYAGLMPGAASDEAVSLWTLGADRFEPAGPGAYKGFLRTGGHQVVATAQAVRVDGKPWLDCATGGHAPGCAAIVTHGLSGVAGKQARLAVGFADGGERRHVCVIDQPWQACREERGNSVVGRLPLLSSDGRLLAVAGEQRQDTGRGEHTGWDLVIYRVVPGRDGPALEPLHRISDIRIYGDDGQGGDFVAYDGSYGWLDDRLFYQRSGSERGFQTWSQPGGTSAWQLPSEIAVSKVTKCGSRDLKDQFSARDAPLAQWDRLIWVPAPRANAFQRDCEAQGASNVKLRLIDAYAVQPLRLRGATHVVIQALVESGRRRTPLERILLFRLE
jgi:hypothetical protein